MGSEPTSTRGYIDDSLGLDGLGTVVDILLENTPELQHPQSIRTYARMRHDPQIASILEAYGQAINRANWTVDPDGCRDEVAQRVADDLGIPVKGTEDAPSGARRRRFNWREHVRLAGMYRVYGHAFFEQAWLLQDGWRLDVVQERMPQTIAELVLNNDGTLKAVKQGAYVGSTMPVISTVNNALVYYTRHREGSNYYGQSLLRACYGPWLIKEQMLRVHATSIRRFGMGVPGIEAPNGATPQQIAEAQRLIGNYRATEHAALALPNGFKQTLTGLTGSVPDALGFITYLDRAMTRATLTSILDMAAAERGNRSLGETVMALMVMAQKSDAEFIAAEGTRQIVVPLVDANFGENEPAPCIHVADVGADVETTAQDINWLMQYGGLRPDAPARAWIRQVRGIPEEDPTDPVFQLPPEQTPPDQTPAASPAAP